ALLRDRPVRRPTIGCRCRTGRAQGGAISAAAQPRCFALHRLRHGYLHQMTRSQASMSVSLYSRIAALAALGAALVACITPEPIAKPVAQPVQPRPVSLASFDCVDGLPALHRQIC